MTFGFLRTTKSLACSGWRGNRVFIYEGYIGLSLGIIASIRVTDSVVALLILPVLFKNKASWQLAKDVCLVTISCFVALLPMLLYLKHTTGSILTNPYHAFPVNGQYEGFTNLSKPQIVNFLFSVRKGLFFWSPVLVLAFGSVGVLIKRMRSFGVAVAVVLCLDIYICASWWYWSFGGSFGSRPFVDMMPLLGVALATGIYYASRHIGIKFVCLLLMPLALLNLVLMYSYWRGYVTIDDMTWSKLIQVPGLLEHG
jgi:hypothetical protein